MDAPLMVTAVAANHSVIVMSFATGKRSKDLQINVLWELTEDGGYKLPVYFLAVDRDGGVATAEYNQGRLAVRIVPEFSTSA